MLTRYSKALVDASVSDYIAIDNKGHYKHKNHPDNIITRNELENVRARETGWKSKTERNHARKSSEYKRWIRGSLDSKAPLIMDRNQFEKMYIAAKNDDNFNNTDANGPFAQLLVKVGLRDENATYPVGQTPKKGKR
jgi:hypothetical protein